MGNSNRIPSCEHCTMSTSCTIFFGSNRTNKCSRHDRSTWMAVTCAQPRCPGQVINASPSHKLHSPSSKVTISTSCHPVRSSPKKSMRIIARHSSEARDSIFAGYVSQVIARCKHDHLNSCHPWDFHLREGASMNYVTRFIWTATPPSIQAKCFASRHWHLMF